MTNVENRDEFGYNSAGNMVSTRSVPALEFDLTKETPRRSAMGSARAALRKQTDEALRRVFELAIDQLDGEDRLLGIEAQC